MDSGNDFHERLKEYGDLMFQAGYLRSELEYRATMLETLQAQPTVTVVKASQRGLATDVASVLTDGRTKSQRDIVKAVNDSGQDVSRLQVASALSYLIKQKRVERTAPSMYRSLELTSPRLANVG